MSYYWHNEAMGHSQYETPLWELTDDKGYKYYIDPHTHQATYTKPDDYAWESAVDPNGYTYYYNTQTAAVRGPGPNPESLLLPSDPLDLPLSSTDPPSPSQSTYDKPWFLTWTQVATEV